VKKFGLTPLPSCPTCVTIASTVKQPGAKKMINQLKDIGKAVVEGLTIAVVFGGHPLCTL
jgi:hypothetical protein